MLLSFVTAKLKCTADKIKIAVYKVLQLNFYWKKYVLADMYTVLTVRTNFCYWFYDKQQFFVQSCAC